MQLSVWLGNLQTRFVSMFGEMPPPGTRDVEFRESIRMLLFYEDEYEREALAFQSLVDKHTADITTARKMQILSDIRYKLYNVCINLAIKEGKCLRTEYQQERTHWTSSSS